MPNENPQSTSHSKQLVSAKSSAQEQLDSHRAVLDDLDELGEIISEMLERQQVAEVRMSRSLDDDNDT